ncbi:CHAT domain-containing protein [Leifsonia sp. 2TAF2]|uniref:CHAT domain-containing protein n=1 Tax=Leifsonia sp. 2TAF2 TaxID=3233009 RepID=UPI003F963453
MSEGATDSSELIPADIQRSWDEHELDVVADWIVGLPKGTLLLGEVARMGRDLADALVPIDPQLALGVLNRLLDSDGTSLELLQLAVDAASRMGDAGAVMMRATALREGARHIEARERAAVLNNLGVFLKQQGAYEDAETVIHEAIDAAGEEPTLLVPALVNLATLHFDRARYRGQLAQTGRSAGLDALAQAEHVAAAAGDTSRLGTIWYNRGYLYATTGASALASHSYDRAEEFFIAAGSDPIDLAILHRARAADAGRNGRLEDAITGYAKSRDLFARAGSLDEAATSAVGLIMAMQLSSQTPTAKEQDDVLTALSRSRPDRVPELLMNLGNIAIEQDVDVAERYFLEAEAGFARLGREVDVERARHAQAVIWRRRGDAGKALEILEAVRRRYREWGLEVKVAEATFNIGLNRRDQNDPAALEDALSAFEILDRHRHELASAGDRAGVLKVTYPHLYDLVIDTALLVDDADVIAAIAERARTQTTLGDAGLPGIEQLAPPVPVRARFGSRVIGGEGEVRTLCAMARSLGGDRTVWVSWVRHRESLLRVVVADDIVEVSSVAYPTDLLADLADATLFDTDGSTASAPRRAALFRIATGPMLADSGLAARIKTTLLHGEAQQWVGRHTTNTGDLLESLATALLPERAWTAESVVLAPPSWLGGIPWAALQRHGSFWIEQARLALAPPVGTIGPASSRVPDGERVWIADPRGDLRYCRRTLPGWRVLSSESSTTDRHHVIEALRDCALVTVRGHVRPGTAHRPRAAALVLADAAIGADELKAALGTVPQEWVILGCDAAGAGVGDEWAGLPVALGSGGAERLIVTLWPIVDAPEQEDLDLELVAAVDRWGLTDGLRAWQQAQAVRWRESGSAEVSPHRWAGHALVLTAQGRTPASATS